MRQTISFKLLTTAEQDVALAALQKEFSAACNQIVSIAVANKCANRVALHHLAYYAVREAHPALGSQMVCNAIKAVADAYKAFFADSPKKRREEWKTIVFSNGSVYYDARTYSMKSDILSLFTLSGRIKVSTHVEDSQARSLAKGGIKEAELVRTRNRWYFNLVLDLPDGVDIGKNTLSLVGDGGIKACAGN